MDWNGGYLSISSFLSFYLLTQNTSISSRYALAFWSVIMLSVVQGVSAPHRTPCASVSRMTMMLPGQNGIASGWSSESIGSACPGLKNHGTSTCAMMQERPRRCQALI
ncbi:hypothetical protein CABS03_09234 [Colletotrichum abscissum]|uniref:Uncharacterized protein n=1 Tax=Colletotrichum abscissum TaxID=1671311 RepID=A0A9Q0B0C2_9PEZI|nr:hypothetical protein CABS02_11037 [Colletotrichum abscissum]